jgi:hypothetical protein
MKIVVCGSMVFAQDMCNLKKKLVEEGHEVVVPSEIHRYLGEDKPDNKLEKIELNVIKNYFEEIKNNDAILVLNKDKNGVRNYTGGNSLIEMAFAYVLGKKIFLFNPIPKMGYSDEIEAMQPIILNGNLNKIL